MGRISKQIIFFWTLVLSGCEQDAIIVLPNEYCIVRKNNKIYQISLTITDNKDSIILADYFLNKGNGNKFCLKNWKNDFDSGWSQEKEKLVYKNCTYKVQTSFQDDRFHQPLIFTIDSIGNIIVENK